MKLIVVEKVNLRECDEFKRPICRLKPSGVTRFVVAEIVRNQPEFFSAYQLDGPILEAVKALTQQKFRNIIVHKSIAAQVQKALESAGKSFTVEPRKEVDFPSW